MYEEFMPPEGKEFGPPVPEHPGLKLRQRKGSKHVKWYLDLKVAVGDKAPTRICLDTPEGPWPGPIEKAKQRYWEERGNDSKPQNPNTVVEVAVEQWLVSIKNAETQRKYRSAFKNDVLPVIKRKKVKDVTEDDVLVVIAKAEKRVSKKTGNQLSDSQLYTIRMAMTTFFTWSTKRPHQFRLNNPVKLIDEDDLPQLPPAKEFDRQNPESMIVTEEQIDEIAARVGIPKSKKRSSYLLALQLELYVQVGPEIAPRICEFFGLMLNDYTKPLRVVGKEKQPAEIFFQYQVNRYRKQDDPASHRVGLKSSGATSSKKRVVACSPHAERKLDEYIARGRREGWLHDGGPLCPQENGLARNPGYASKVLKEAVDAIGFDKKVTSHIFRHTWASNALDQGHELKFIGEMLGNSEVMVDKVYAHRVQRTALNQKQAAVGRR